MRSKRGAIRQRVPRELAIYCDASEVPPLWRNIDGRVELYGEEGPTIPEAIRRCRLAVRRNWFMGAVVQTRAAFVNYGLRFVNEKGRPVPAWEDEFGDLFQDFADEAVEEWLTIDNIIAIWHPKSRRPLLLAPEHVDYKDGLGVESITYDHRLGREQVDALVRDGTISADEAIVLKKKPKITLPDDMPAWRFVVRKRNKLSGNLAYPRAYSVISTHEEIMSHEAGDAVTAGAGRTVFEQHMVGHEPRAGLYAGTTKFNLTDARRDAIIKGLRGKTGLIRFPTNYDHKIAYVRVDPKMFSQAKYEAAVYRLLWWSMPLGHIVMAKAFNPYFLNILQSQVVKERDKLARFLCEILKDPVFNQSYGKIRPRWSNRCFLEPRLAADMLKFGLSAGPASQTSYQEAAGLDPEVEYENKKREASMPKDITFPLYDANHGPDKKGGKPPGGKDQG